MSDAPARHGASCHGWVETPRVRPLRLDLGWRARCYGARVMGPGSKLARRVAATAAALSTSLAAGCAPQVRLDAARLERSAPRTVAVLPFELPLGPDERDEDGALARKADALRAAVARRLGLSWQTLDVEAVDEALASAGLSDRLRAARAPGDALARLLGVDAVVRGRVRSLANVEGVVLFFHTVAADLQLVDARRGEVLARVSHAERALGGFLPESQQAVRAILTTVENSTEAGYLRLAERFAEAVADALPAPPGPSLDPAARLDEARVAAPARALVAGDALTIDASGTPGASAVADLGPDLRGLPLEEVAPGRYRAVHVVGPGEQAAGPVTVRLRDRFGDGVWRVAEGGPVTVDARGPERVAHLRTVTDPAGELRLCWRAAAGATRYRVYAFADDGRPALLVETDRTFVPLPPGGGRVGVAGVDERGNLGPVAAVTLEQAHGRPE